MKKRHLLLLCLALILVASASLRSAMAYFTTYTEAKVQYPIYFGDTDIEEEFSDWTKHVVITSTADAQPVYVRARAFAGELYKLVYSGDGWTEGNDGYYYYDKILYGGEKTAELQVKIENIPKSEDVEVGTKIQVVVVYETVPVQFGADGDPLPADWSQGGGQG